jgi:hypothetical protein
MRPIGLTKRARSLENHWGAALVFGIAVFALLGPTLVGLRVLLPSSILYFIPPWTTQKPPDVQSYFNPVLTDIPTAYYPWWSYARESIRAGSVPQWNPYALGGTPFYANAQSALFSPFSLPLWLLPFNYAFGIAAAMRLWVTAFGTYLLCRELRLSFWASVFGGLAFGFSAFSILWLSYPVLSVLSLLPLALWLATRIVRTGSGADGLGLVLVLALALLGGHPGSELHLYTILGLYTLMAAALLEAPVRGRLERVGIVASSMLVAAALTAFVLIPVARAVPGTTGVEVRSGSALTVPWAAMRTLFFPDWWGRPSGIFLGGPFNYNERTVYAGAVTLLLAVGALFVRGRWRTSLPFAILALLGFEAAFGLEPVAWTLDRAPALSNDRNARLSLLIQLGGAVLAAIAFDAFLSRPPSHLALATLLGTAGAVVGGGVVATHASFQDFRTALHHFRTGDDFARAHVVELVTVGWWALLAALLLAALLARRRTGAVVFGAVVLVLAFLDAGHFARGYNPMAPPDRAVPIEPPVVRFLKARADGERVVGLGVVLPPDVSMLYGLEDVRGNDPPYPDRRYFRFFRLINPRQSLGDWLAVPQLTPRTRRLLNLLNVRYIVSAPVSRIVAAPGLTAEYRAGDAVVYRDHRAITKAYVPAVVKRVGSEAAVLSHLSSPSFEPRREALVERALGVGAGSGRVHVRHAGASRVDLDVRLARRSLVVLTNAFHPGWRVMVDGRSHVPVRVDSVIQGVVVDRGVHSVRWSYRTPGLDTGIEVSGAGIAAALAWALLVVRSRMRLSDHEDQAEADRGDTNTSAQ